MLTYLRIKNFALVSQLELEFTNSMSVITGETGAGKSILLDALGLALGQRADGDYVRKGTDKADIHAHFSPNKQALDWLAENDLEQPTDEDISLRRVLLQNGRSRAYINNQPVSASSLKQIATYLIAVHAQQAHQQLLEKDSPRKLLDAYAQLAPLCHTVECAYNHWQQAHKQLQQLTENTQEQQAKQQLLSYQVQELDELNLQEQELLELEAEQKQLANAEQRLLSSQQAAALCFGDEHETQGLSQSLHLALQALGQIDDAHPALSDAKELLNQASIQIDEASISLNQYVDGIDINPHKLAQTEERLSQIYALARKHQIKPEQLYQYAQQQRQELAQLSMSDEQLQQLEHHVSELFKTYHQVAQELHHSRLKNGEKLQQAVQNQLTELALGGAQFFVEVHANADNKPQKSGIDEVQFLVQTNANTAKGTLAKVASGGELSRLSLAIQVVTAATSGTPSLIFDEVDVGIGGATAARVGQLLAQLGTQCQVMCVTHQAQVAAAASQHFQVSKISGEQDIYTQIRELNPSQRENEIARMIGGVEITQATKAHAIEMLK